MDSKLVDFYPWNSTVSEASHGSLDSKFVLCLDRDPASGGEFAFTTLLLKLLRKESQLKVQPDRQQQQLRQQQQQRVIIISACHGRHHYETILKKNGLDMLRLESSNQLIMKYLIMTDDEVINPQTYQRNSPQSCHLKERNNTSDSSLFSPTSSSSSPPNSDASNRSELTWTQLVKWCEDGFCHANASTNEVNQSLSSTSPFFILIDDLEMLECIAPSPYEARQLVALCHNSLITSQSACNPRVESVLSLSKNPPPNCCGVVVYGRVGLDDSSNEINASGAINAGSKTDGEPSLSEYCKYRADMIISIAALSTGYSSEVHGIISVNEGVARQSLNFKTLESGIKACLR